MKKTESVYISIIFGLLIISCSPPPPTPLDTHIKFRIAGVNFSTSEEFGLHNIYFKPVNLFEFALADPSANPFRPYTFSLHEIVNINSSTYKATLPNLDKEKYYNYMVNKTNGIREDENNKNIMAFNLYDFYQTRFMYKEGNTVVYSLQMASNDSPSTNPNNVKNLNLKTGTTNDLTLFYSFKGKTTRDIDIVFNNANEVEFIDRIGEKSFNYNVQWEEIIRENPINAERKLNIIVMADGYYNDLDLIQYRKIVEDMKNELFQNNFFIKHQNDINIFRLDTISLEGNSNKSTADYNIIGINSYVSPMGNEERIIRVIQTSFAGGPLNISNYTTPRANRTTNIDAIVVISKSTNNAYTFTYDYEIATKNKQPVTVIIMPNNLEKIHLAHMLGHALARLQDETYLACNFGEIFDAGVPINTSPTAYYQKYRNISSPDTGFKWQMFIEAGYPQSSQSVPWYGLGTEAFPFKQTLFSDKKEYYIPTLYSTMSMKYYLFNIIPIANYTITQFGPVNFYHLEASYLIRTGKITGNNKIEDQNFTGNNNYEWVGYKFSEFKTAYPPGFFSEN